MIDREPSLVESLRGTFGRRGQLEWIGLRPGRREPMRQVEEAWAEAGRGLCGDRAAARRGGRRQVTIVQWEHLAVIASLCGRRDLQPGLMRRNLAVAGISVLALQDRDFRLGAVVLRGTGLCHPCSRMEEALGPGGYNAVRGHGGITAEVVVGGPLRVGDALVPRGR
ncbi:MAG: MOSC domain-containing protein [Chromatiales bacterium]|jgi:MOSC domain-containing protein YiiM